MASRHPDPIPPPDPESGSTPDLAELVDHLAFDLAREYVGLLDRRPSSRPPAPNPPPKED